MPRLSEPDLRRPGFREGYKVALADGQEWTFPRPVFQFYPARTDTGEVVLAMGGTHDERYRQLRDELIDTGEKDYFAQMRVQVLMAGHLLLMNYDLDSAALRRLLPVNEGDPDNDAMWGRLADVILANPPKPSADGSSAA